MTDDTKSAARLPYGMKAPFSRQDLASIRSRLTSARDLALFETAVSTMLRAGDVLNLRVRAVTDAKGSMSETATITQQKSSTPVKVPLSSQARAALARLIAADNLTPDTFLFRRQDRAGKGSNRPLTTRAFRAMVQTWADLAGYLDVSRFSCHSLRRTRASIIYKETGKVAEVSKLLGHASLQHTLVYLNVSNDDAIALSRAFEV